MDSRTKKVLIVDDDAYGLSFFKVCLLRQGYEVYTATCVEEAKRILNKFGTDLFDCVLTDFWMPKETGLDLLRWIRLQDKKLSCVMITAQDKVSVVKESLREGVVDFLDKPINNEILIQAIEKAVQRTFEYRKADETQHSMEEIGSLQGLFVRLSHKMSQRIEYYFKPLRDVSGDFLNVIESPDDKIHIILGDVSGHGPRAAFLSAYFQGVVRGLLEKDNCDALKAIELCNKLIYEDLKRNDNKCLQKNSISLSVIVFEIDFPSCSFTIFNAAMPFVLLEDKRGFFHVSRSTNQPLGWSVDKSNHVHSYDLGDYVSLHMTTDGLIDTALSMGINHVTLSRLVERGEDVTGIDDVMFVHFNLTEKQPLKYSPIILEQYRGDELSDIDMIQDVWRRSLQYFFTDDLGDRVYDFLLCCREAVLNALQYGCDASPEKLATFQVSHCEEEGKLRVRVDDPGKGHSFNIEARMESLNNTESKEHLGLGLIRRLCDHFTLENEGSTLIFEFSLNTKNNVER